MKIWLLSVVCCAVNCHIIIQLQATWYLHSPHLYIVRVPVTISVLTQPLSLLALYLWPRNQMSVHSLCAPASVTASVTNKKHRGPLHILGIWFWQSYLYRAWAFSGWGNHAENLHFPSTFSGTHFMLCRHESPGQLDQCFYSALRWYWTLKLLMSLRQQLGMLATCYWGSQLVM